MTKLDTRRRLSKFNDAARNTILGAVRAGATFEVAARAAGISRQTLINWLRRGEYEADCGSDSDYANFARAFLEAEAGVLRRVENNVLKASDQDWRAGRFILSKRLPHIYGDKDGAAEVAQRTVDWMLDRVRTTCDQATYGKVLTAISGAVEIDVVEAEDETPADLATDGD